MNKWIALDFVLNDEVNSVDTHYWDDKEFVFNAVHWNGYNFKYASENLKNDKEFILEIISYSGCIFKFIDNKLKSDSEFVLKLLDLNVSILYFLDLNNLENNDFKNVILKKKNNFKSSILF